VAEEVSVSSPVRLERSAANLTFLTLTEDRAYVKRLAWIIELVFAVRANLPTAVAALSDFTFPVSLAHRLHSAQRDALILMALIIVVLAMAMTTAAVLLQSVDAKRQIARQHQQLPEANPMKQQEPHD
jgi:hypothetical protein